MKNLRNLLSIEKVKRLTKGDVLINCIGLLPHVYKDNSITRNSYEDSIYSKFILVNSILPHNLEKIKIIKTPFSYKPLKYGYRKKYNKLLKELDGEYQSLKITSPSLYSKVSIAKEIESIL